VSQKLKIISKLVERHCTTEECKLQLKEDKEKVNCHTPDGTSPAHGQWASRGLGGGRAPMPSADGNSGSGSVPSSNNNNNNIAFCPKQVGVG
jgi:hypothetical protein